MSDGPRPPSLELFHGERVVFSSALRWLHPLFELERYLADGGPPAAECRLHDRIVGRAAALLEVRLGLRVVRAGILSRLGEAVFLRYGVDYACGRLVDRIACKTEELVGEQADPETAYRIVAERARAAEKAGPPGG